MRLFRGINHHPPSPVGIWLAIISVYVVWGSTYLAIRYAVQTMPPFLMAGARFLISGSLLYIVRRVLGDPPPTRREWRSASIIGILLLVGGNGGVVWAEQWVVSGVAALLVATAPLWMILIDTLHPHGLKYNYWVFLGVLLGFAGIFTLIHPFQSMDQGDIDLIGAAVLIFASLLWSIGSLYSRHAKLPSSPLLGTGMEMLAGSGGLLLLGILTGELEQLSLTSISKESWLGLVYLIIFGSLIGFTAYTWLLRSAPTPLVSTYAYVNPIVAIFLGYFIAEEPLTLQILIATVLVVGSVALITIAQQKHLRSRVPSFKSMGKKQMD